MSSSAIRCVAQTAVTKQCSRWTRCGNKCVQHLRSEDQLLIAPSGIAEAGLGLFTTKTRRKGERIAPYTGKYVKLTSLNDKYGGVYVLQLSRTLFIDAAAPSSGAARYSNTARSHNVARKECHGNNAHFTLNRRNGTAWITATRSIPAGEEVFTAYGGSYPIPLPDTKARRKHT